MYIYVHVFAPKEFVEEKPFPAALPLPEKLVAVKVFRENKYLNIKYF